MKKTAGTLLIALGIVIFLGFLLSFLWMPPCGFIHTGKALFSQEGYLEFKEAMASKDVDLISVDILNSDFPILVNYSFVSSSDTSLFGEDVGENPEVGYMILAFASVFAFVPGIVLVTEGD